MRQACPRKLEIYRTPNGRAPYTEWLKSIGDRRTRRRIQIRIDRLEAGNLGDYRPLGDGVFELRLRFGPDYRVYFGEVDNTIVLLLCGGDKSSQARDIERAKAYWREYKESRR
jgi:putative addiction module killer protein